MVDMKVMNPKSHCDWQHKDIFGEALYVFLFMHTTDDARQVVELQDENGLEAWRQLAIRFDPIRESWAFDQMTALMDAPRCKQMVELQATLTRWERSLRAYSQKTGAQVVLADWK